MGRWHHSCGATHSVLERCDFACTHCYLTALANATPPLPESEVRQQLDRLRAYLGPQGKVQLTAGEVTLLPAETLGRHIAYAREIGLDPMVMSHGQRFLDEPAYLRRLVEEFGLRKVAIHVDTTQRGRPGWRPDLRERELHTLRDRFALLLQETRQASGRTLYAAHTATVTEESLEGVPAIARWVRDHPEAFRLLSLQPAASVGRSRLGNRLGIDEVWRAVCRGMGRNLNPRPLLFGHPGCNLLAPLVVLRIGTQRHLIEVARSDRAWDRKFLDRFLDRFGGLTTIGCSPATNAARLLSLALRNPCFLFELGGYGAHRLWGIRRVLPRLLRAALRRRPVTVHPLAIVIHRFMDEEELDAPLGRERLASCVFKVPVGSKMVSMCELNATAMRRQLNEDAKRRDSRPQPSAGNDDTRVPDSDRLSVQPRGSNAADSCGAGIATRSS